MKKLLTLTAAFLVAFSATAASWKFSPLLSGYNVLIESNQAEVALVGLGDTNVQYTTYEGAVVFSLTNNTYFAGSNGVTIQLVNTNLVAPDAFKLVDLYPDANGDITSNATMVLWFGFTNWCPQAFNLITNSITGGVSLSNNWILAPSTYPNWLLPATPNTYPSYAANTTNEVLLNIFRCPTTHPNGSAQLPNLSPRTYGGETTPFYTYSAAIPCGQGTIVLVPLSNAAVQGHSIYITCQETNITGLTGGGSLLLNQAGVIQPIP